MKLNYYISKILLFIVLLSVINFGYSFDSIIILDDDIKIELQEKLQDIDEKETNIKLIDNIDLLVLLDSSRVNISDQKKIQLAFLSITLPPPK